MLWAEQMSFHVGCFLVASYLYTLETRLCLLASLRLPAVYWQGQGLVQMGGPWLHLLLGISVTTLSARPGGCHARLCGFYAQV